MKVLASHPQTESGLRRWAGGRDLIIASYYFYHNGRDMQKSQKGLMQSLVFKVLQQSPGLVDTICRDLLQRGIAFDSTHPYLS